MLFKRNYKHNGQWYSVVLDGAGLITLHEKLRQDNLEVLKECFKDASRFGKDARAKERVAVALFGKLADAKYTRIKATLDEIVEQRKARKDKGLTVVPSKKGKACGDTCISRDKVCHVGPGCACDG
jgi:hypothetical protein